RFPWPGGELDSRGSSSGSRRLLCHPPGQWCTLCGVIELAGRIWHKDTYIPHGEDYVSTMLIVALVVGGLVIVVGIGFFSQALERARRGRARALAELQARLNHCNSISASLPGQFMSAELKRLLLGVELRLLEQLLRLDPRNSRYSTQLEEVR